MQLGLILAYVLMVQMDLEPDYHQMTFDTMPTIITENSFLRGLLCKGKYDGQELEGSVIFQGKSTIEEVIRQRHN